MALSFGSVIFFYYICIVNQLKQYTMETLFNAWDKLYRNHDLLPKDKFVVVGGNEECGTIYDKKELVKNWKKELRFGYHQDISLYYNGKLIRSVRNGNATILGKLVRWGGLGSKMVKTEYIKH